MKTLPYGCISKDEQELLDAWRSNNCGPACCAEHRLKAALLVIRGGKTHEQYSKIVLEAAEAQTKRP